MITGMVKSDEGRIRLKVKGLRGRVQEVEAVIDTGYSEWLTLPAASVAALGLRWRSVDRATLADGSECLFDVYEANVVWDGKVRRVLVDEADADPPRWHETLEGLRTENAGLRPRQGHHQTATREVEQ